MCSVKQQKPSDRKSRSRAENILTVTWNYSFVVEPNGGCLSSIVDFHFFLTNSSALNRVDSHQIHTSLHCWHCLAPKHNKIHAELLIGSLYVAICGWPAWNLRQTLDLRLTRRSMRTPLIHRFCVLTEQYPNRNLFSRLFQIMNIT